MKKEYIEIVDEKGVPIGKIVERKEAHEKNLLHMEVAAFIINSNGEILLQKRSSNKMNNPNKWGIVAGHVNVNEKYEDAILRETNEEIGIHFKYSDLNKLDRVLSKNDRNYHITDYYYIFSDFDIKDCVIDKNELSEIKWIDVDEVINMIENNDSNIVFSTDKLNLFYKLKNKKGE